MQLTDSDKQQLLELARDSIRHGLQTGTALAVDSAAYPSVMQQQAACFVTLNRHGQLRGCIGHLAAQQELVADVAENAFSAAFNDPRFTGLRTEELDDLHIEISVLTPAEPMQFSSEADLLEQIQPGVDGLVLEDGFHRGTFLPSVWEQLPDKQDFWRHLKLKAGLSPDHWSDKVKVSRYRTLAFEESEAKQID